VADGATPSPEGNACSRNTYDGVAVFDCASSTLEENVGSYNDEAGISYYEDAGARRGQYVHWKPLGDLRGEKHGSVPIRRQVPQQHRAERSGRARRMH
jgi:parallel beta-helix repeat protein